MVSEQVTILPEQPESVAEWEDLLVRLEIVPRVVRNTVEDVRNPAAAALSLARAAEREASVGRWLEAAARMEERDAPGTDAPISPTDLERLAFRFASLRARTFAMVQRRGLEVWAWEGPLPGGGSATVHQLLLWLAGRDAVLLAELRGATRSAAAEC